VRQVSLDIFRRQTLALWRGNGRGKTSPRFDAAACADPGRITPRVKASTGEKLRLAKKKRLPQGPAIAAAETFRSPMRRANPGTGRAQMQVKGRRHKGRDKSGPRTDRKCGIWRSAGPGKRLTADPQSGRWQRSVDGPRRWPTTGTAESLTSRPPHWTARGSGRGAERARPAQEKARQGARRVSTSGTGREGAPGVQGARGAARKKKVRHTCRQPADELHPACDSTAGPDRQPGPGEPKCAASAVAREQVEGLVSEPQGNLRRHGTRKGSHEASWLPGNQGQTCGSWRKGAQARPHGRASHGGGNSGRSNQGPAHGGRSQRTLSGRGAGRSR